MKKLVCGIGTYDEGIHVGWKDGKATLEYVTWNSMLTRGASNREKHRNITYAECSVDERFLSFQWFATWANAQVGFGIEGYDLDKDILLKGNKVYTPDLCVFVPRKLNTFLIKCDAVRGSYPVGVSVSPKSNGYMARCRIEGDRKYLGTYSTPEAAFLVYKVAKEAEAKRLAREYVGKVDTRVVDALYNYTVDITD